MTKPIRISFLIAVIAIQCAIASPVAAQGSLNMGSSSPNFGSSSLAPGFTPDPFATTITSGGGISVADMNLGSGCVGFATSEPDYILKMTGPMDFLAIYNEGNGDTGLIINDASGAWHCDDDSHTGTNPMVSIYNAQPGQYDIWVSSYSASDQISGTLYFTELQSNSGNAGSLNMGSSNPNFGSSSLAPGFTPDPFATTITSGGGISVADMNLGSGCVGFATSEPDYILKMTGPMDFLAIYNEGNGDTGLIINDASGAWHCDDDSHTGTNPMVSIYNAQPGQYDIWVSSYSASDQISGTLYFTEIR